ncbi:hypothetical protein [Rhodobacter capsulatus]|uniref:hypothetical protein n=1 Tax=Rhodobacter capsulatus TaxID=1061 RepID=UPI004024D486
MREARDYLTRPNRDLAMVCALAGVDTGALPDHMGRKLADRTGLSWFTIRERHKKGCPVDEVLRPDDLRGARMKVDAA